jgi:Ca-activated chloride channel family protein
MLTLAQPLWLILLPVAWFGLWFAGRGAAQAEQGAAITLVHPDLSALPREQEAAPASRRATQLLHAIAVLLFLLALAQPQWQGGFERETPLGRDIMLLLDASDTMSIPDFELGGQKVSRLDVLRSLARQFVAAREGDRFGLIAFGDFAATLAPPTFDRDFVSSQLGRLRIGAAGEATAIGDAVGLALKQVRTEEARGERLRPVLLLFSDGDNTAGEMRLSEALALAKDMKVALYTVHIGSDLFAAGRAARSAAPDGEPKLQALAEATGGRYYVAGDSDTLRRVIADIGNLEPTIARPPTRRSIDEWYWLPLLAGLLCLSLARLVRFREQGA